MDQSGSALTLTAAAKFKQPPKNIVITDNLVIKRSGRRTAQKQISANKNEQQLVSNDVMLTGFPLSTQLNCSAIAAKLFKMLDLPSSAKNSSQFESKDSKTVLITCKDKEFQTKVLEKARIFRAGDFTTLQDEIYNNRIHCQRRLSRFNSEALRELIRLLQNQIIGEIKFEGLFYQYKHIGQSKWKEVTHKDILDALKQIEDNKKILDKKHQGSNSIKL